MSLAKIEADPSLEQPRHHLLPQHVLEKLEDAEALYELGRRRRNGANVKIDEELGWELTIQAAKLGHPVALATCLDQGKGTEKDSARALELYKQSAARSHPAGMRSFRLSGAAFLAN
jgi:TPR repeat protein